MKQQLFNLYKYIESRRFLYNPIISITTENSNSRTNQVPLSMPLSQFPNCEGSSKIPFEIFRTIPVVATDEFSMYDPLYPVRNEFNHSHLQKSVEIDFKFKSRKNRNEDKLYIYRKRRGKSKKKRFRSSTRIVVASD